MNIWFLIWIVISAFLLGFLVWTLIVLHRQKLAWRHYAKKHNLKYRSGKFMESPVLEGSFQGYDVLLFTNIYLTADQRSTRNMTAIELRLQKPLPFECGVASGDFTEVLTEAFPFETAVPVESKTWSDDYLVRADDAQVVRNYLTPKRLKGLSELMKLRSSWVLFVTRNDISLLRVDMPYALEDEEKLDKMLKGMAKLAHVLELDNNDMPAPQ